MQVSDTNLVGVKVIVPDLFEDARGAYLELFDTETYRDLCGELNFVQDDISFSNKDVLRGVHGDFATTKLVSILNGTGYALLADNRPESASYRQWQAFRISRENRKQLLIPPGIGNSVVALTDNLIYHYKQTTHFEYGNQFTIRWDDESWGFEWPIEHPILSARDMHGCYSH